MAGRKELSKYVINILMLTIVLAMAGSAALFKAVGGGAIAIAGGYFVFRAISLTFRSHATANFYQLALTWVPGVLAMCSRSPVYIS